MELTSSQQLGRKVCQALGIDANTVAKLTITMDPSTIATVVIHRVLTMDESDSIVNQIGDYQLVPKNDYTAS